MKKGGIRLPFSLHEFVPGTQEACWVFTRSRKNATV